MRPRYLWVGPHLMLLKARLNGFSEATIPAHILPLDMLRALRSDRAPCEAGVYFLWRGPQLLYIGQSTNLDERLWAHHRVQIGLRTGKVIPFTFATWATCDHQEDVETAYIRAYLPPYNSKVPN